MALGDTALVERGATVLAIERGDRVLTLPRYEAASQSVKAGLAQSRSSFPNWREIWHNLPKAIDNAGSGSR